MEHYETGEACRVDEIGKILVKGDSVMSAYFDDFEATALHIRHGWYDTGDMGYRDEDGYLWHVGRLGRFLKIGGEMVSLVQVEDMLQRAAAGSRGVRRRRGARRRSRRPDCRGRHGGHRREGGDWRSWPKVCRASPCRSSSSCCRSCPKMPSGKVDYRALTESGARRGAERESELTRVSRQPRPRHHRGTFFHPGNGRISVFHPLPEPESRTARRLVRARNVASN